MSRVKPLTYPLRRLLRQIEQTPGHSRAELAAILYKDMNPIYSLPKLSKMVKALERRGLVELGQIREGGRAGVPGVWLAGQKQSEDSYLGIFGKVKYGKVV